MTKSGKDVSKQYVTGARRILKFCQEVGVEIAVLKARNPACGSKKTLDGTFAGTKRPGKGVTTKLLSENGIKVYNEDNFPEKILNKA